MKKLLIYLDTDVQPGTFDQVVAYDAGVDAVLAYGGVDSENCFTLVEGAIYTRAQKHKQNTAILVGGSDLDQAEAVFAAVRDQFFGDFRVSVMLDANGCNTTAAAAVVRIEQACPLTDVQAAVLAGTGPVGQRAAAMMAQAGAQVRLTSRRQDRAEAASLRIRERFDVAVTAQAVAGVAQMEAALDGVDVVLATGSTGVQLLSTAQRQACPTLRVSADVGTCPPLGVEGMELNDSGRVVDGVQMFGGLAIGALKLRTQRAAIAALFTRADQKWDALEILDLARKLQED